MDLLHRNFGVKIFSSRVGLSIIAWDLKTIKILQSLNGHSNGVSTIEFAKNDKNIRSYDWNIIFWNLSYIQDWKKCLENKRVTEWETIKFETYWKILDAKKGNYIDKLKPLINNIPIIISAITIPL